MNGFLYLIDRETKQKIAIGTDIRKMYMLRDVLQTKTPCFLLTVIKGGKAA